jgi:hypothetical protein
MIAAKTRRTGSQRSLVNAATDEQWAAFETDVEPVFSEYGVNVLHTKDLHDTDGEFKGWKVIKKQAFVAKICRVMSKHVPLGMSMSALKETFASRAAESGRKRTVTPYTFCSNIIIDWVLTDIRVGRIANIDGVAFILGSLRILFAEAWRGDGARTDRGTCAGATIAWHHAQHHHRERAAPRFRRDGFWAGLARPVVFCGRSMTFANARSNASGLSSTSTSRAMSMNRLCCSGLLVLRGRGGLRGINGS